MKDDRSLLSLARSRTFPNTSRFVKSLRTYYLRLLFRSCFLHLVVGCKQMNLCAELRNLDGILREYEIKPTFFYSTLDLVPFLTRIYQGMSAMLCTSVDLRAFSSSLFFVLASYTTLLRRLMLPKGLWASNPLQGFSFI